MNLPWLREATAHVSRWLSKVQGFEVALLVLLESQTRFAVEGEAEEGR